MLRSQGTQEQLTQTLYCSVLNNRPVWLFAHLPKWNFIVINSTVLILRSSNFNQMPYFLWGISLNDMERRCLQKSYVLMLWWSPWMIIRSGLLSSTLQYLCSSRTLCPLFRTPAYKTLPFLQSVDGRPKPRIVKGEFAQPRQFPWMAGLMSFSRQRNPFCGGTLITDRHIVTAAHCLQSKILQFE